MLSDPDTLIRLPNFVNLKTLMLSDNNFTAINGIYTIKETKFVHLRNFDLCGNDISDKLGIDCSLFSFSMIVIHIKDSIK